MKTFKRPMFRRGGNVDSGIMSGMKTNRTNFQGSTTEQMIKDRAKLYRQYAGDPLANLLIQGGLGLVSGEGAGKGTLGAVATAFQKPTQQALVQEQQIGLKAVGDVLSEQQAMKLAMLKNQGQTLKARRQAIAMLPPNATESDIQKMTAKILQSQIFGVESRFTESKKIDRIKKLQDNPQIRTQQAAEIVYDFEGLIGTAIPKSKVNPNDYIIRKDKKGNITSSQLNKPGIYIDLSVPGGRIIEIIDGKSTDVTAQYRK